MRLLVLGLPFLALAAPVAAGPVDPVDAEIARALPSQGELDALGAVLGRVTGALMDVEIGGILDAIDPAGGDAWKKEERARTIGDLAGAGDPYAKERVQRSVETATSSMGDVMADIAILAPRLLRTFESASRDIEDAARDLPGRDYRDN
jgi:hypothetical protein